MSYATAQDMADRFGTDEMVRVSATGDELPDAPDEARIQVALDDATAIVEGYLRARYLLPLSPIPREMVRATCVIARVDLNTGDGKVPTKEMLDDRAAVMLSLEAIAGGTVRINAPTTGSSSGARVRDRRRELTGLGLP